MPTNLTERRVRVFVSSTFLDMHPSGTRWLKKAFPLLRALCEARGITWGEVDLALGSDGRVSVERKDSPGLLRAGRRLPPCFMGILGRPRLVIGCGFVVRDAVEEDRQDLRATFS